MYNDNFHTDSLFSDTWRATLMTVYAEGRGESHREWYFAYGEVILPLARQWYSAFGKVVFRAGHEVVLPLAPRSFCALPPAGVRAFAGRSCGREGKIRKKGRKNCACVLYKRKRLW